MKKRNCSVQPLLSIRNLSRLSLKSVLIAPILIAGCATSQSFNAFGRAAPAGATEGTCWDRTIIPARIETVTEQVLVHPPVTDTLGKTVQPAIYATETRQNIVSPREERFFEILCPEDISPEYIASLQRALAVRDVYTGPITGLWNRATSVAVHRFQTPLGIDSTSLSLDAARQLGLTAVERTGF